MDAKKKLDDLFDEKADDDQFRIVGESKPSLPTPDALLIEAVLIFYRELGLRQSTIAHIAERSMRRHKGAMKTAVAHILKPHLDEREMRTILGSLNF